MQRRASAQALVVVGDLAVGDHSLADPSRRVDGPLDVVLLGAGGDLVVEARAADPDGILDMRRKGHAMATRSRVWDGEEMSVRARFPGRLLYTLRSRAEGGAWEGSVERRKRRLIEAASPVMSSPTISVWM